MDNSTAVKYAKELSKFCGEQFCPKCIFHIAGHCRIGELGNTPQVWNQEHQLDNLE